MTLSMNDTQHSNVLPGAECHILFTITLNVAMLSVVTLSVEAPCTTAAVAGLAMASLGDATQIG